MKVLKSAADPITKYVFDSGLEFSLIRRDTKTVVTVPTQSGCKMGCTFCFLTARKNQEVRNLTASEVFNPVNQILEEVWGIEHDAENENKDLLISFMSSGEPLNNLDTLRSLISYYSYMGRCPGLI